MRDREDMMLTRRKWALLCGMILGAGNFTAQAVAADVHSSCPVESGFLPGEAVPTAQVAKDIYLAIMQARFPKKLQGKKKLAVVDEGESWGVSASIEPIYTMSKDKKTSSTMTVTTTSGGGGVEMSINKCNGSIRIHLSK